MFDFDLVAELKNINKSQESSLGLATSWKESLKNSLKTKRDFEIFFETNLSSINYKMELPRKFAQKVKNAGKESALYKQFVPSSNETNSEGLSDPIGDEKHSKSGNVIHRYKNRALLLTTSKCAGICRFCFRKNSLGTSNSESFEQSIDYLKRALEIDELIFSGGDPLTLPTERLNYYLERISNETLVRYVRFHTRIPVLLPERIDNELTDILELRARSFTKMMIVLHVNHPSELDNEVIASIKKLQDSGIEVLSQTVLLKGINDSPEVLKELIDKLLIANIRPYYLHHPDQVKGGMHFYISLEEGRKIYAKLRNIVSGWALPQYIIDIPGGMGKTQAFNPESFECSGRFITKDSKIIKLN